MLAILSSYDQNNKWNLFVFEVGPSVKFVSAIKDAIFNKKNGGKFFFEKMPNWGGPRGVWQKTRLFPVFFFAPFPNTKMWTKVLTNVNLEYVIEILTRSPSVPQPGSAKLGRRQVHSNRWSLLMMTMMITMMTMMITMITMMMTIMMMSVMFHVQHIISKIQHTMEQTTNV